MTQSSPPDGDNKLADERWRQLEPIKIGYVGTPGSAVRLPLLAHGDLPTVRSIMPPTAQGEATLPGDW